MANQATQLMIQTAHNAGVPRDQLENFLKAGYVPLPWQMKFHAAARRVDQTGTATKLGAGGARGPGKSFCIFAQICLDDCQRVPGLKALFLRQTGRAAQESFNDLILRVLTGKVQYKYNETNKILTFQNGSRVVLGGFQYERDIDNYVGIEYDLIAVEELNQLTKRKVDLLLGSMRTSKSNWRPRFYASFNPGGIGHGYVRETFVLPSQNKTEKDTLFFPSTYKDNPFLNQEYLDYLEGLEGSLGKAWRDGNFDIFEGQFFQEFDYNVHVIEPFRIPPAWRKFGAYDHGRAKPACFLWFALDYDGNIWVYRELYVNQEDGSLRWEADQIAKEVAKITKEADEYLEYVVADAAIFSQHGHGETLAEVMQKNGMGKIGTNVPLLIPSHKDRLAGWAIMHQYLYHTEDTPPKMRLFNTCVNSIRTIPEMIHSVTKPEDLNTLQEDHVSDVLRYFLQTLREKKAKPPITYEEKKMIAFQRKIGKIKDNNLNLQRFDV